MSAYGWSSDGMVWLCLGWGGSVWSGCRCDHLAYSPYRHLHPPRSGELRTQKLSHLVRTQSLNVLPFGECSPCVGLQNKIGHTAGCRFPRHINRLKKHVEGSYPQSLPLTAAHIFSKPFLCWLWLTHGSCVGPQNKIGHPACSRVECRPTETSPVSYTHLRAHET